MNFLYIYKIIVKCPHTQDQNLYSPLVRVTRGEMDPGAKWTYWVLSIILPEIEQSTVVQ